MKRPQYVDDARDYGLELVTMHMLDAREALIFAVVPLTGVFFFVGLYLIRNQDSLLWVPLVCIGSLGAAIAARWPVCEEKWPLMRRHQQELKLMRKVMPLAWAYRLGYRIEGAERDLLYQVREMVIATADRFREEANEWRKRGRAKRGDAMTALILDLEDTLKLINDSFGTKEREIRPEPPAPKLLIAPPPIDQDHKTTWVTGLEE